MIIIKLIISAAVLVFMATVVALNVSSGYKTDRLAVKSFIVIAIEDHKVAVVKPIITSECKSYNYKVGDTICIKVKN